MENKFILTSAEFAKLIDISTESLRSRRRRGLYEGMYIRKSISYLWLKPAPNDGYRAAGTGPNVRDAGRLSAHTSNTNMLAASRSNLASSSSARGPRKRNKNSRKHYQELSNGRQGTLTKYPNKAFEVANEIRMLAKAQRKISAAAAEEIIPEVIEIAQERHRQKILAKMKEPFIPEAHKDNVEAAKSHYKILQKDESLDYEEDSSKWKNPLNPEDNRVTVVKKKSYY